MYVRLGVEVAPLPFEDMALPAVIEQVLKDAGRPLSQTDLVVKMIEQSYETSMEPKMLRNHVGAVLCENADKFSESKQKWQLLA